ncbi:MAG: hypothetical protein KGS72_19660 [Cyanobacteria bacterium REEB67]|nr:hypothetical protein [Cyanobacteria bacterium REEB67]
MTISINLSSEKAHRPSRSIAAPEHRKKISSRIDAVSILPADQEVSTKYVNLNADPVHMAFFAGTRDNAKFNTAALPVDLLVPWRWPDCGHRFLEKFENLRGYGSCRTCRRHAQRVYLQEMLLSAEDFVEVPGEPTLSPANLLVTSRRTALWRCSAGHEYLCMIKRRTQQNFVCPVCREQTEENSFFFGLYPHLLQCWDAVKNLKPGAVRGESAPLSPDRLVADERNKYWLLCIGHGHSYKGTLAGLLSNSPVCPRCLPVAKNLAEIAPYLVGQWCQLRNGDQTPWNTKAGSSLKVWWQCLTHQGHLWETSVFKRVSQNTGCPYCANRAVSTTNSLATLYPEMASRLNIEKNGAKLASDILACTKKALWWNCKCGSTYQRTIEKMLSFGPGCRPAR